MKPTGDEVVVDGVTADKGPGEVADEVPDEEATDKGADKGTDPDPDKAGSDGVVAGVAVAGGVAGGVSGALALGAQYGVAYALPAIQSATMTVVYGPGGGAIMAPIIAPLMTFTTLSVGTLALPVAAASACVGAGGYGIYRYMRKGAKL